MKPSILTLLLIITFIIKYNFYKNNNLAGIRNTVQHLTNFDRLTQRVNHAISNFKTKIKGLTPIQKKKKKAPKKFRGQY